MRYDGSKATCADPNANLAIERSEGIVCGMVSDKPRARLSNPSSAKVEAFCTRSCIAPERANNEVMFAKSKADRPVMILMEKLMNAAMSSDAKGILSRSRDAHHGPCRCMDGPCISRVLQGFVTFPFDTRLEICTC